MNNSIPNWMKKWLDLFNKETQIRNQEFIPTESEIDNEVTLTIKYDEWDKQPYMSKEQQELLDEAYKNYLNKAENYTTEDLFYNKLSGVGDVIEGKLAANTRNFIPYTQEEFINKIKTDTEFSEKWGLTIEERELSLEERNNVYKKQWEPGASELSHDRFNSLNIPTKLITITYNDQKIENYEFWNKWMHV